MALDQHSENEKRDLEKKVRDNFELENDTYGHIDVPGAFSQKNAPEHSQAAEGTNGDHLENSAKLKDTNLINKEDIDIRNSDAEKGIGGKEL